VVQQLAKRAAVVDPARLLAVDRVNCLVPKVCEEAEEAQPMRHRLVEGGITSNRSNQAQQRENDS
jgi:hypothetical protein